MTPGLRKFLLTLHVVASVGWMGAVAVFLALAVAGLLSSDSQIIRASYIAMDLTYRTVVVSLGLASLATGLVSSLGTDWGLFRYYWIIVKLLVTVPAIILMLVHVRPVSHLASVVSTIALPNSDLARPGFQLLMYVCAALFILLVATVLSTYKPRGKIRARRADVTSAGDNLGTTSSLGH
ncbi:hypothetical protein AYJ54_16830 [Bradyrhizobium centrolobii]|uniref:DUF2269 domain-containing protein n=1 Tax=Bradyrhizobium centrolobii TaxID=1505087 RepID=A0A176YL90_9BRAD|nr:hypothetical protein [Bradyrhizobium centrolobii]OAF07767.1 hypothetical protein AYJ54_16830 [Bradyrhizobium centrolobii]